MLSPTSRPSKRSTDVRPQAMEYFAPKASRIPVRPLGHDRLAPDYDPSGGARHGEQKRVSWEVRMEKIMSPCCTEAHQFTGRKRAMDALAEGADSSYREPSAGDL